MLAETISYVQMTVYGHRGVYGAETGRYRFAGEQSVPIILIEVCDVWPTTPQPEATTSARDAIALRIMLFSRHA